MILLKFTVVKADSGSTTRKPSNCKTLTFTSELQRKAYQKWQQISNNTAYRTTRSLSYYTANCNDC